jgi:cation diffusion facilitator CzcD-associated flavoprotein CzcO
VPPLERLARGVLYLGREAALLNFRHRAVSRLVRRISLRHLARQVPDPALRARLTPRYDLGCKRVLLSDDYLPVLARPDVELVTEAIREVRPHSVVTADGTERPADTIIFGTGFHVTDMPVAERIRGRDGRTLAETWRGSPQAHLGVTVAGFPNLFLLLGPNTGLGHTSVLLMVEAQIRYVVAALDHMRRNGIGAMSPRPAAQAAFVAEVDRRMRDTVWQAGGCTSWYLDATGRNSTLWPGSTWGYRRRLARLRAEEYETVPAALPVGVAS